MPSRYSLSRRLRTRMTDAIATIAAAYELPKLPKIEDVFSRAFLPAKPDRMLPAGTN